jgi:hypothetical protein
MAGTRASSLKGMRSHAQTPTKARSVNTTGNKTMTNPTKHRLIIVTLFSTTFLGGCVVWQSDYDKLQAQNQQLQQQLAADQ